MVSEPRASSVERSGDVSFPASEPRPRASSIERAKDFSFALTDIATSVGAAWAFSKGVRLLGERIEDVVLQYWSEPFSFTAQPVIGETVINFSKTSVTISQMPAITFAIPPEQIIPIDFLTSTIRTSTKSANTAAISVGVIETLYQAYRYAKADERSWGIDILEGSIRSGGLGAATGFLSGGNDLFNVRDSLVQRITAAVMGGLVGMFLGGTVAGIGHAVRAIHVPR